MGAAGDVTIRGETVADHLMIRTVHESAFGGAEEADLIEALRRDGDVLLSLVAELDSEVVGHIMFSRMSIDTRAGGVDAVALAPVAVLPRYQRQGIGGRLTQYGLAALRDRGERIAIVVGHAAYYPRFGFSRDLARALESPFPPDVFMALELSAGALGGIHGRVRYPRAFGLTESPDSAQ